MTEKKAFQGILKSTSVFGGVQVIQILTSILRAKVIAIILGPTGMGISGLLVTALNTIGSFSNLGINFSAVRDISIAYESNDSNEFSSKVAILKKWILWLGIAGSSLIVLFSSQLSQLTFGDQTHRFSFVLLSLSLFFGALTAGNFAILQGARRLKDLAKSNVIGATLTLVISIPIFYFFKLSGIVPAIISGSIIMWIVSSFFMRSLPIAPVKIANKTIFSSGTNMVKLGIVMMVSSVLGMIVTYSINAFISHRTGVADVGLYQAGISITNQYVGLIFVAMSVDYFPRLSAISQDSKKINELVNQQAEIVVIIITPLLCALIISAPIVIDLLLSDDFQSIVLFVRLIALGLLFKGASYALGYVSFAKGDKRTFFLLEGLGSNILTLTLNLLGYYYGGLNGLGVSFFVVYLFYFVVIVIVTRRLYQVFVNAKFVKILCVSAMLLGGVFVVVTYLAFYLGLTLSIVFFLSSTIFSFYELDKRISIKEWLLSKINAKN
jgi:O-antigen/teichoic acid export membrane protein